MRDSKWPPKDNKTVFIIIPPTDKIDILYVKEIFIKAFLKKGYFAVVVFVNSRDRFFIEGENCKVTCFDESNFIMNLSRVVHYLLYRQKFLQHSICMKDFWRGFFKLLFLERKKFKEKLKRLSFIVLRCFKEEKLIDIQKKVLCHTNISRLYRRYAPCLTVFPCYAYYEETVIAAIAQYNGSITVAIPKRFYTLDIGIERIYSFYCAAKADLLLVWNDIMKEQAVKWHGYSNGSVVPIGIVKCDYYKDKNIVFETKEEFISKNNLYRDRKIISIICGNIDLKMAYTIAKMLCASTQIRTGFQIILRANPDSFEEQLRELRHTEDIDNSPIFLVKGFSFCTKIDAFRNDVISAANFLKNSDLIISVASTMMFESLYFNTPNIFLIHEQFRSYYDNYLMRSLMNEKGIAIVKNDDELITAVDRYLKNPLIDIEQRQRLFKKYCYSVHGDALDRFFNEIDKLEIKNANILKEKYKV